MPTPKAYIGGAWVPITIGDTAKVDKPAGVGTGVGDGLVPVWDPVAGLWRGERFATQQALDELRDDLDEHAAQPLPVVRGIIIPNAAVGTDKTQPTFPGGTWSQMYGTDLYKVGSYFTGATLVNNGGAQYVQIDRAGLYIFELQAVCGMPSSAEVGYGITSKADADGGIIYRDAHNHEKPYAATSDYKVRQFQRLCSVGDLIAPIQYFSGATGNVIHYNQATARAHFSFVRVSD